MVAPFSLDVAASQRWWRCRVCFRLSLYSQRIAMRILCMFSLLSSGAEPPERSNGLAKNMAAIIAQCAPAVQIGVSDQGVERCPYEQAPPTQVVGGASCLDRRISLMAGRRSRPYEGSRLLVQSVRQQGRRARIGDVSAAEPLADLDVVDVGALRINL